VDAGDEKSYTAALKEGVAHAAGSNLPGEKDTHNKTVYIFGHSTNGAWNITRYNALFYSLKDLTIGDSITLWFWGKQHDYKVTNMVKVDPSDVSYLQPQTDKDQLILQTCWPPGTTWKRLLVVAEPTITN
jgi:LPXTG-site transpeptidase (sortase) family protein